MNWSEDFRVFLDAVGEMIAAQKLASKAGAYSCHRESARAHENYVTELIASYRAELLASESTPLARAA